MEDSHQDLCPACEARYKTVYYQRRSADEPPDKVTYCPDCPLNISKLSLDASSVVELSQSSSCVTAARKPYKHLPALVPLRTKAALVFTGAAASRCIRQLRAVESSWETVVYARLPATVEGRSKVLDAVRSTAGAYAADWVLSERRIAPATTLQEIQVFSLDATTDLDPHLLAGDREVTVDMLGCDVSTTVRATADGSRGSIVVELDSNAMLTSVDARERHVLDVLQRVLLMYGTEDTVKSFMSPRLVSSLYNRSSRAYDWAFAPDEGYLYSWKPDGERFWLVKYGSLWVFARRLLSGRITGWLVDSKLEVAVTAGPVLDVEVMIGFPSILLDVLVLENGEATPAIRDIHYVLGEFAKMDITSVPIHVKTYYKTMAELERGRNSVEYPIDGAVGVHDGSMDIIKLKSTKSMELLLDECGNLLSCEGTVVAVSTLHTMYDPGSIIELRFARKGPGLNMHITESILRTDKVKANQYEVCQDIVNSSLEMPDSLARRRALMWCNSIRHFLHRVAAGNSGKGRVILDIGSGDGQAVSDYSSNSDVSYILLEPDMSKCKKLMRRIGESGGSRCKLYTDSSSISKVVSMVSTGSIRYAIVCDTLQSLLLRPQAVKSLRSCVRCCVSCFSVSYTAEQLRQLALSGLDVVGCGYMYDAVDSNGVLIDVSGVKMKQVSSTSATVVWGSDTEYAEPVVRASTFSDVMHVRPAADSISVPPDSSCSLLRKVADSVYLISTKKHI